MNLKLVKTKKELFDFIERINLDEDVKIELVAYISKLPEGTLNYAAKNFRFIVNNCIEKVLTRKNLNNISESVVEVIPEIVKTAKKVVLPTKQPIMENVSSGIEIEMPKQEQKAKWTTLSQIEVLKQFEAKKPIPEKKSKSFEQIGKEVEAEVDKFLNDEEFMKKLMDKK